MLRQWRQRRKLFRERFAIAERRRLESKTCGSGRSALLHDPIEDDPQMQPLLAAAEALARAQLSNHEQGMGFCHLLWRTKQRILKEQSGITWFSPSEMNPGWIFD